jgi:D-arginine dehydrogenase
VVADALERMTEFAATLASPTPTSARAGLRTFAPDCRPVLGADPVLGGFFWLAGQGGCGIETSATLGRVSAQLIATGKSDWPDLAALSPRRF